MKTLYIPVFWIGFSLSLSALLMSSERLKTTPIGQQPVLMNITAQPSSSNHVHLGDWQGLNSGSDANVGSAAEIGSCEQLWQRRTAGFLSAAEDALR